MTLLAAIDTLLLIDGSGGGAGVGGSSCHVEEALHAAVKVKLVLREHVVVRLVLVCVRDHAADREDTTPVGAWNTESQAEMKS